jgi:hypothetical protein
MRLQKNYIRFLFPHSFSSPHSLSASLFSGQVVDRRVYRSQLKAYSQMSTSMRTFYAHSLSTISGDQSLDDLKRETIFTLCRVIANQPKLKGRLATNLTSTHMDEMEPGLLTIDRHSLPPHDTPIHPVAVSHAPSSSDEDALSPPIAECDTCLKPSPPGLIIPPLQLQPMLEISPTFSLESFASPHAIRNTQSIDVRLCKGLISESVSVDREAIPDDDGVIVLNPSTSDPLFNLSPRPAVSSASSASSKNFRQSLSSLGFPLKAVEEKSESFLSVIRRLSSSSKRGAGEQPSSTDENDWDPRHPPPLAVADDKGGRRDSHSDSKREASSQRSFFRSRSQSVSQSQREREGKMNDEGGQSRPTEFEEYDDHPRRRD